LLEEGVEVMLKNYKFLLLAPLFALATVVPAFAMDGGKSCDLLSEDEDGQNPPPYQESWRAEESEQKEQAEGGAVLDDVSGALRSDGPEVQGPTLLMQIDGLEEGMALAKRVAEKIEELFGIVAGPEASVVTRIGNLEEHLFGAKSNGLTIISRLDNLVSSELVKQKAADKRRQSGPVEKSKS
jgi:hypothetical protein